MWHSKPLGPNLFTGVSLVSFKLNFGNKDGSSMPLAMKVFAKPGTGSYLFPSSSLRCKSPKEELSVIFKGSGELVDFKERKIRLWRSPDRSKAYLDGTIARRRTEYFVSLV